MLDLTYQSSPVLLITMFDYHKGMFNPGRPLEGLKDPEALKDQTLVVLTFSGTDNKDEARIIACDLSTDSPKLLLILETLSQQITRINLRPDEALHRWHRKSASISTCPCPTCLLNKKEVVDIKDELLNASKLYRQKAGM